MNSQHDDSMLDLVAAYAAGAIDASTGECAGVRAHIAGCPICQEEFRISRAATSALGLSAAETPPPALRQRILTSLPPRVVVTHVFPRTNPWFVPAAAAAAVVIAAGVWWSTHHNAAQSWTVACTPTAVACHASGSVTTVNGGGLHVQLQGLAQLPPGKQYQAWMIAPGGAPKPEPVFSPDSNGRGSVDMPESAVKGATVAITIEPAGGSRAPTSKPFVAATID